MQPLKFPCSHCGKRMTVPAALGGKPVRCPHCKQVLTAPVPPPASEPPVSIPPPLFNSSGGSQAETTELSPTRPESAWEGAPGKKSLPPEDSGTDLLAAAKKDPFGLFGSDSNDGTNPEYRRRDGSESIFEEPGVPDDSLFPSALPGNGSGYKYDEDTPPPPGPRPTYIPPPPSYIPPQPAPPQPPPTGRGSQGYLSLPPQGFPSGPVPYSTPHAVPSPFGSQPAFPLPAQPIHSGLQTFAPPPPVVPGNPWAEMTGEMPGLPDAPPPARPAPQPPPAPVSRPTPAPQPRVAARESPEPEPPRRRRGWVVPVLLVYALVATAAAVWSWLRGPDAGPLSTIPDFYGEYEKADRKKVSYLPKPDDPLPPGLRVTLGRTITVGQLEVEPLAVEQRKLTLVTDGAKGKADDALKPALVLSLRLKNVSPDVTFHPLDPAFNRKAEPKQPAVVGLYSGGKPLFLGGPIAWPFRGHRVGIKGQDDDKPLLPGETQFTFVPLVDDPGVPAAVKATKGPLTWKVLLRRGTVRYWMSDVSVCALIGVEFAATDVKWLPPDPAGKT